MHALYQKINTERIVWRIEELAKCSVTKKGVTRFSFSKENEMAHELVAQWMRDAGMTVRRDGLNNIIGRYEGKWPDAPALLIGSHLDSIIEAGKYDGVLGVIAGIEVVQTLYENGMRPNNPMEVIGFCDEEGARFHTTLLGSRAMAGNLREEELFAKDGNGTTLAEAMKEFGLDPLQYNTVARNPKTILGYLELHIEQGPILEQMNQPCGVVSGIAGQSRYKFRVEGLTGHAGTVPLSLRKDALVGTAEMIQTIERLALQYESLVATVGKIAIFPGASNVIPGLVEGTLDVRSVDDGTRMTALNRIFEECEHIAKRRGLICEFTKVMESPAVICSSRFIDVISSVLKEYKMKSVQLVSGAGHDAMAMASITDIGMIFVRCKNGLSHHPDEFVSPEDIKIGTSVLLDVSLKLTS
ncbi:allantoate amidohydrolase [Bacillus smithii]|uniref:allantoate amidohydrolase n=1 Tax=Bacillus smithii TaxID=1479 RepID=UPI00065DD679|nr:allantoate amidohydrolase [Bacillus smithii]AKP47391.1 N-carbamoyl-L-amino acid hydrolase [Bacillus smithii]